MFASFYIKNSSLLYYMYETYDPIYLDVFDPEELDDDHFSKIHYSKQDMIVCPKVECHYKPGHLYVRDTGLLEWFDRFYQDCIRVFHETSKDWFEDPLTLQDVESSFLSPLKASVKGGFEVMCRMEGEERTLIPRFHIKGIQFNSKHFFLVIDAEEDTEIKTETETDPGEETLKESDDLSEFHVEIDSLPSVQLHLDTLSIYKVYDFLNQKVKDSLADEIRGIFASKKIKTRLDFSEVFDDEEAHE